MLSILYLLLLSFTEWSMNLLWSVSSIRLTFESFQHVILKRQHLNWYPSTQKLSIYSHSLLSVLISFLTVLKSSLPADLAFLKRFSPLQVNSVYPLTPSFLKLPKRGVQNGERASWCPPHNSLSSLKNIGEN